MSEVLFKGAKIHTCGTLPAVGMVAPEFSCTKIDLTDVSLKQLGGKKLLLNVFPSVDTSVCAASVRRFNQEAANRPKCQVLCISADLPFAHARFCAAESINNLWSVSIFRFPEFGQKYGLQITDRPLAGLLARAVVVINPDGKIGYTQLVGEIAEEPNYAEALKHL